jgi:DNA-directed RNA polymerase subunit beta'
MINSELPTKYRNYNRVLTSKTAEKLLTQVGKEDPQHFANVINSWKDLGATYSYLKGHTISITDFVGDKSYRNDLLKAEMPKINKMKGETKINALNALTLKVQDAQGKAIANNNFIGKMLESGSFSKTDSIRQILSMPGVMQDINGNNLEMPILKSYGEGLDTASYWNSLYSVRKGTVDRAVNTQESGALNKALLNVNRRLLIVEVDCNTNEGLEFEINDKNVMDRTLLFTVPGIGRRGAIVDNALIQRAREKGITKLKVRSPLTCHSVGGICQLCYGLMPDGQLPSIGENVGVGESQAVTERSTQLTMKTFHSGGSALGGGGIAAGFPRIEQLLKVPEKLSGKATLAEETGIVKEITKNLTGGYNVIVGAKNYIVPPGRIPIVSIGSTVKKGAPLSDGAIKPQELGELTSHLDAQRYIVKELGKVYENKFYDKTFETVLRGISDNAEVTKSPDDLEIYRGDKMSISYLDSVNRKRKKDGLELIEYKPYFKSIDTLNTDSEDWLTRITTNRIKAGLTIGASKGQYGNIKGKDPVPAYLYGDNFGRSTNFEKGEFY